MIRTNGKKEQYLDVYTDLLTTTVKEIIEEEEDFVQ